MQKLSISKLIKKLSSCTKISLITSFVITLLMSLAFFDRIELGLVPFILRYLYIFYTFGIGFTGFQIILKEINFNIDKKLTFFDWYSHIRVLSFLLWLMPLFWIYAIIKINISWSENKVSLVKDRFFIFAYSAAIFVFLLLLFLIIYRTYLMII